MSGKRDHECQRRPGKRRCFVCGRKGPKMTCRCGHDIDRHGDIALGVYSTACAKRGCRCGVWVTP